jgi:hypothetical protein
MGFDIPDISESARIISVLINISDVQNGKQRLRTAGQPHEFMMERI